jgi:hypothetical protein
MITSIIDSALKILMPLVGWFVARSALSADLKRIFYDFVSLAQKNRVELVEIRDVTLKQYEELKQMIEERDSKPLPDRVPSSNPTS